MPDITEPAPANPQDGNTVAKFLGWQPTRDPSKPMALFNLTQPVGVHPIGSTVGVETLARHGYSSPTTT